MPAPGSEPRLHTHVALLVLAEEQASDVTMGTSATEAPLSAPCGPGAQGVSPHAVRTRQPPL